MALTAMTVNAVQFDCRYTTTSLKFLENVYTCNPIVTSTETTSLISVTGDHDLGRTNYDVEFLWISNQNLGFVPQRFEFFFKNLKALELVDIKLTSISAEDLKPFSQLKHLSLFWNSLSSIDDDLFYYTPLLEYLDLGWNQIQHIGPNLFTNLANLEFLLLGKNICIDSFAETRSAVVDLDRQISVLCAKKDLPTTTELPGDQCACGDEIRELREENQQQDIEIANQNLNIAQLQQSNDQLIQSNAQLAVLNSAVEKRLVEIERKLHEMLTTPCYK